jgi:hypothetical protein
MTRSRILATLVALLAFAGTASARIQVEPVERDGRDLVPIAMDFGFEQGGERRGEIRGIPPTASIIPKRTQISGTTAAVTPIVR